MQKRIPGQITANLYIIQQKQSHPNIYFLHYNIKAILFHFFFADFML